jgi:hypothetical protein
MKYEKECQVFEERWSMDSEEFLNKFESGELGDDLWCFDWYAVCRARNIWLKKYNILKGFSWKEQADTSIN